MMMSAWLKTIGLQLSLILLFGIFVVLVGARTLLGQMQNLSSMRSSRGRASFASSPIPRNRGSELVVRVPQPRVYFTQAVTSEIDWICIATEVILQLARRSNWNSAPHDRVCAFGWDDRDGADLGRAAGIAFVDAPKRSKRPVRQSPRPRSRSTPRLPTTCKVSKPSKRMAHKHVTFPSSRTLPPTWHRPT